MRGKFFRHLIGGIAIGTTLGAIGLAGLAWIIQPHATSLPWSFAFVGLFQMASMGGVVGVATFLRAILKTDAPHDDAGGPRLPVDDEPIVAAKALEPQPA
jgi:hypothetical protein